MPYEVTSVPDDLEATPPQMANERGLPQAESAPNAPFRARYGMMRPVYWNLNAHRRGKISTLTVDCTLFEIEDLEYRNVYVICE